jgi:hypothetical protein
MTKVKWAVGKYLDTHGKTPYAFMKASGLAQMTAYSIANGKGAAVHLDTLGAVVAGLEKLTGREVTLNDLFEIDRSGDVLEVIDDARKGSQAG